MSRVLVLGATGRAGSAIITELPAEMQVVAVLRAAADIDRLPKLAASLSTAVADLEDPASIRRAADGVDVIVNAIRLREDIAPGALVELHQTIRGAAAAGAWIVTIGGAGSLHMPDGRRFWEHRAFPARTLPRGVAHACLRDRLESGTAGARWTYLIPPPAFHPDGPRTGRYETRNSSVDESSFVATGAISYADFALAAARHAIKKTPGTLLIHGA